MPNISKNSIIAPFQLIVAFTMNSLLDGDTPFFLVLHAAESA